MCLRECKIARVAFLRPRENRPVTCCAKGDTQTTLPRGGSILCVRAKSRVWRFCAKGDTRVAHLPRGDARCVCVSVKSRVRRPRGNRPVTCCAKGDTQTTFPHVETLDLVCAWVSRVWRFCAKGDTRVAHLPRGGCEKGPRGHRPALWRRFVFAWV